MDRTDTDKGLFYHTPPENQGQIVTVSYASDGERVYRRTHDASDGSSVVWWLWWEDVGLPDDVEPQFEPWNGEDYMSIPGDAEWNRLDD